MKKTLLSVLFLLFSWSGLMAQNYVPTEANLRSRAEFENARFGIFLHWGIYSVFGQGEWFMTNQNINCHEYAKVANAFYPHDFDASRWVAAIKDAGARYICFTTRHHDGFSMWNTAQSDYNVVKATPFGRDVVKELADACHSQNIRLHLYYSHLDWTRPDYWPLGTTGHGTGRTSHGDFSTYYDFMNRQLTELLSNYGSIGAIWFDGWWDHENDKTPFNWRLPEQYALIHRLQPACLVGNNHHQTPFEGEDFQMFERDVPGENKAGLSKQSVSHLPLETCQTMNGMWGYKVMDQNYKSAKELIQLLVKTSGKGANLLLNIGPQPDGNLPASALERLKSMGQWLRVNGATIYGTQAGGFADEKWGTSTRNGKDLYLHILNPSVSSVSFPYGSKVKHVETFPTGSALEYSLKKGILTVNLPLTKDSVDFIVHIKEK